MIKTKAQFIASCFEHGAISELEVLRIGHKESNSVDQDWYDEVTSFQFDDESVLSVFNDTVEVQ